MFSLVFLSYTSRWKQSEKSKTKSGNSGTGFPRRKHTHTHTHPHNPKEKNISPSSAYLKKINSLVNLVVKEHKYEKTMFTSPDFWFQLALYLDVCFNVRKYITDILQVVTWGEARHHLCILVSLRFVKINSGLFHSL